MVIIERIGTVKNAHGEGPIWDERTQSLYWVDWGDPMLYRYDAITGSIRSWTMPTRIGSLALAEDDCLLLACADGIFRFSTETSEREFIIDPEENHPEMRLNDGKVDRRGRVVVGSMYARFPANLEPRGGLYSLGPDLSLSYIEEGIVVPNGPCWSPDGATMYLADSGRATVYAYDYDLESGTPSNRRILFQTDFPREGAADGITTDAEGCLWTAMVMGGRIARYSPDGKLLRQIEMPANRVTSVAFGGTNLDVLFVTSGGKALVSGPDPAEPDAGGLFSVRGLGVSGIPEPRFQLARRPVADIR